MNPSPSDRQWLVLYQVDEGAVWFNGGDWWSPGVLHTSKVTAAIRRLWQLGLIVFPKELVQGAAPSMTTEGNALLKQRSVYDVLEKTRKMGTQ